MGNSGHSVWSGLAVVVPVEHNYFGPVQPDSDRGDLILICSDKTLIESVMSTRLDI